MSNRIIEASGIGKQYRIGSVPRRKKGRLAHVIADSLTAPVRNLRRLSAAKDPQRLGKEMVWALRDVSFDVHHGEVLGIVGRNGAGKSTLLKILSRITNPSVGYVDMYGRVGSLLEVGTGFHSELSGRDNVFLNGSILGMDRGYIKRRFDEIVEFAGIGSYLDTPVKHYSSGMRVRLAFAVAAHLEPEILIVDEVLAVGDAEFQRKCLAKMDDVGRAGRTVLFVSHDMSAVQRLCPRCLLIDGGRVQMDGSSADVVARHLAESTRKGSDGDPSPGQWMDLSQALRSGTGEAQFEALRFSSGNETLGNAPYTGGPLEMVLAIRSDAPRRLRSLAVRLSDATGTRLINADLEAIGQAVALEAERTEIAIRIEALHLNPGIYTVGLWLSDHPRRNAVDHLEAACRINVLDVRPISPGLSGWGAVPCTFGASILDQQRRLAIGSSR